MKRIWQREEVERPRPGMMRDYDAVAVPLRDGRLVVVTGAELMLARVRYSASEAVLRLAQELAYDEERGGKP